jgi:hypothetical protein
VENGARQRRELERAVVVDCRACRALCGEALDGLLRAGAIPREDPLVRALLSCAAVTETTAAWLEEDRRLAASLLEFCAETCEAAAQKLEAVEVELGLRECADTCRATADSVRALLWSEFEA